EAVRCFSAKAGKGLLDCSPLKCLAALLAEPSRVRGHNHLRMAHEHAADGSRARFGFQNVEARAGDLSSIERGEKRCFVNQGAARRVDDERGSLHLSKG